MKINVNNQIVEWDRIDANLSDLVEHLAMKTDGVAIALNHTIVPKNAWMETVIQANDDVAIFSMIAGG